MKIIDAIEMLASGADVDIVAPGGVGTGGLRYESPSWRWATSRYVDDLFLPGMLHGAFHLAAHARAESSSIERRAAAAVPGVSR